MNRNAESHFAELPRIDHPRSIFSRPSRLLTSFNVGDLIPIYVDEVLPGDTVKMRTKKLVRMQTLLAPVLDTAFLDTYFFFVPMRLVWEHTKEFFGENKTSKWVQPTEYFIPKIKSPAGGWESGTIADYMGIPPKVQIQDGRSLPSALPFRAYALICEEFFRDENLTDPLNIPTGDATQTGSNGDNYINDVANGGKPFRAAKVHDYFTSCLPSPQRGEPVVLPIGSSAPVRAFEEPFKLPDNPQPIHFVNQDGSVAPKTAAVGIGELGRMYSGALNTGTAINSAIIPDNLGVDLSVATGVTVEELRHAFALQRYLELDARSGTRYVEFLKSHFGVTSSDARLQRPEYLGGNRVNLNVDEVFNTAQTTTDFLGDVGGYSRTFDSHYDFERSFTEHGFLIGVSVVRYQHTYTQGVEKFWTRHDKFDFYDPLFANLGDQPVYQSEIYLDSAKQDNVFGYQEAWADYRYKPNRCSGELRPLVDNTLASWTYADAYSAAPTLSDSWIREDAANVDRTLAVSSKVSNQLFGDFYFDGIWTREMPMYSIPSLRGFM